MLRRVLITALVVVLTWVGAGVAIAQTTNGVIGGAVSDAQGGVLPGVTVTARNVDTGAMRTITTETDGRFRLAGLNPGRYEHPRPLGCGQARRSGRLLGRQGHRGLRLVHRGSHRDLRDRPLNMWRYRELLPVPEGMAPIALGECQTPLTPCPRIGKQVPAVSIWVILELQNSAL